MFFELGELEWFLNMWLSLFEENKNWECIKGSGRVIKKAATKVVSQIKRRFNQRSGVSQRKAALKFNMSQSYISKILKESSNIRVYREIKKTKDDWSLNKIWKTKIKKTSWQFGYNFILDDYEKQWEILHMMYMLIFVCLQLASIQPKLPINRRYYSLNYLQERSLIILSQVITKEKNMPD